MKHSGPDREPGIVERDVPDALAASMPASLHPVLRRVYAARGTSADELQTSLNQLIPVSALPSAINAARRLVTARERHERVLILGDFDADGATGTALMVSCLRGFGFADVSYLVPDRFEFGYGLSPAIAEQAAHLSPDLIVTVDNGVSSVEGVERARSLDMEVLITDHHLPGKILPAAEIIVNPNLPDDPFPSKCLCGVGVAFYVMAALARELGARGLANAEESRAMVAASLDLVALGTVADLVPLDFNNRILVAEGLRRIRAGRSRAGIDALFRVAGRNQKQANGSDLGFSIAPRLNAAGRLTDMSVGIECLLAASTSQALEFAGQLDELNRKRRELQMKMEAEAQDYLSNPTEPVAGSPATAYCLFDDSWHEGIVGLVAGRVKDQVRRPVFAFARTESADELKGSARSVAGVHIRDVIDAVAARSPGLVKKFGGHAMAAGLTINEQDLEHFRQAIVDEAGRYREVFAAGEQWLTDGPLAADELQLELAEAIRYAGPWGQGFPEPLFDNELEIVEQRLLQGRHLKLRLRYPGQTRVTDAIAFNWSRLLVEHDKVRRRFLFRLDVNEYRSRRTAQLVVEHIYSD
jgi:single-stranded-DNA-specific exonuclease